MADVRVIERDRRDLLGEGPLWSAREGALYWTDILAGRLNRLDPATGAVTSREFGRYLGWAIEREAGGLVAGLDRRVVTMDSGAVTTLAALSEEPEGNRVNDAKADALGRVWFGTMPVSCEGATGSFYRLDPDGAVTTVDAPYTIANGPAIAPDARSLFHTDTALRTIFRFAVRDDGSLGEREPFVVCEEGWGNPDGMTLDADGCLWVACWGAGCVTRFTPDGARERSIALPASQITSCTFAGETLDRMYVTSASVDCADPLGGSLFEVDPGCRGVPACRFAG